MTPLEETRTVWVTKNQIIIDKRRIEKCLEKGVYRVWSVLEGKWIKFKRMEDTLEGTTTDGNTESTQDP